MAFCNCKLFYFGLLIFCVTAFSGCSSCRELTKKIAGTSIKSLEQARKSAVSKNFPYDYDTCYKRTLGILENIHAYVYDQRADLIALYVSEKDTTPVGIFFINKNDGTTTMEVSSPSSHAKEIIAARVFSDIEVEVNLEKVQSQINEKVEKK